MSDVLDRVKQRHNLREKLIRELRAGFLETDRALALNAAANVVETIEELVGIEIAMTLAERVSALLPPIERGEP